jgi:carboxyl-terminal processing protease
MRPRAVVVTALACVAVLVAAVGYVAYQAGQAGVPVVPGTGPTAVADAPADLEVLGELYRYLSEDAVDAPDDDALLRGAIDGMIETLDDPYALYFDAEAYEQFNQQLDGTFSGVGLMLEDSPDGPVVVSVLPDTPAERAGIEVGERIVSVDGRDVSDLPLEAIVNLVTGEPGTAVTVGFEEGPEGAREIELTRAEIDLPLVEAELLEDGIGHVRLLGFSQGAADAAHGAVDDLLADGAEGLVLDLRSNPGGLLNQAVDVASLFLDEELVVTVREAGGEEREMRAEEGGYPDLPLVVLVDEGTASASEIVAAAVQDAGRGELVGSTTFGKGTVQTVRDLGSEAGVKFTTAEYLTPAGESIEGTGVEPDREVDEEEDPLVAATDVLRELITVRLEAAA